MSINNNIKYIQNNILPNIYCKIIYTLQIKSNFIKIFITQILIYSFSGVLKYFYYELYFTYMHNL